MTRFFHKKVFKSSHGLTFKTELDLQVINITYIVHDATNLVINLYTVSILMFIK